MPPNDARAVWSASAEFSRVALIGQPGAGASELAFLAEGVPGVEQVGPFGEGVLEPAERSGPVERGLHNVRSVLVRDAPDDECLHVAIAGSRALPTDLQPAALAVRVVFIVEVGLVGVKRRPHVAGGEVELARSVPLVGPQGGSELIEIDGHRLQRRRRARTGPGRYGVCEQPVAFPLAFGELCGAPVCRHCRFAVVGGERGEKPVADYLEAVVGQGWSPRRSRRAL